MAILTRVVGLMIKSTAEEYMLPLVDLSMRVCTKVARSMDLEFPHTGMAISLMASGARTRNMGKENIVNLMVRRWKASGRMTIPPRLSRNCGPSQTLNENNR